MYDILLVLTIFEYVAIKLTSANLPSVKFFTERRLTLFKALEQKVLRYIASGDG